jgi:hypothetical protein
MNTPIYDAMRKELRQRVKARLFHLTYGVGIPDDERPTPTDYEWPFTLPLVTAAMLNTEETRTDLKPLARRFLDPSMQEELRELARRGQEAWHWTHRGTPTLDIHMPGNRSGEHVSRETSGEFTLPLWERRIS